MRTPLMLIVSGILAVGIFLTGDRKRMKTVIKWLRKGDFFNEVVSWKVFKKSSASTPLVSKVLWVEISMPRGFVIC